MNMFRARIAAVTAALLLSIGVTSAASMQSAGASGTVTGDLCVTAVNREDPSIKAQYGNCPVESAPEATPTGQSRIVFIGALNIRDSSLAGLPVHAKVVNQVSGNVLSDEDKTLDTEGGTEFRFNDNREQPASTPLPSYVATLTVSDKTYTYTFGADSFVNQGTDGDVTTYVAEAYAHYQNGGIAAGYALTPAAAMATTPAAVMATTRSWYTMGLRVGIIDADLDGLSFHVKAVNQVTGKVLADEDGMANNSGSDQIEVIDNGIVEVGEARPTYLVTLTVGGKTYYHQITQESFIEEPQDGITKYELSGEANLEKGAFFDEYENRL